VKGNIRFWASPWTPPTWMKEGPFSAGNMVTPFDGGTLKIDAATMQAFAQYLIAFVQAYALQGITVERSLPRTNRTTPARRRLGDRGLALIAPASTNEFGRSRGAEPAEL
jgi:hypothetical protein